MYPNDCNPVEWRASFKIRKIRIILKICITLRTFWNCSVVCLLVSDNPKLIKYGKMANKSMIFKGPLKNFHLFGEAQNRPRYSSVNQHIHTASMISRSSDTPLSSVRLGMVFKVSATVDRTMKSTDTMASTCKERKATTWLIATGAPILDHK